MDINVTRQEDTAIFTPSGRIEGSNAENFHETITGSVQPTDRAVIIDLQQTSYVSSAGLRAFAIIAKSLKAKETGFAITQANKSVKDVITVTGFNQFMNVEDTNEDALSLLAAHHS